MYLVIDCETTGLPKNWKAPISDIENWPRVIQIAWALYDREDRHMESATHLILPEGFEIPYEAQRVHGISTARAIAEGIKISTVLGEFDRAVDASTVVVAHNLRFDESVISAEYLRLNSEPPFPSKKRVCTMLSSTDFCRIQGPYGYKWPTLSQLHRELFKKDYEEAHDAGADVAACAKCFLELKRLRVLSV